VYGVFSIYCKSQHTTKLNSNKTHVKSTVKLVAKTDVVAITTYIQMRLLAPLALKIATVRHTDGRR